MKSHLAELQGVANATRWSVAIAIASTAACLACAGMCSLLSSCRRNRHGKSGEAESLRLGGAKVVDM